MQKGGQGTHRDRAGKEDVGHLHRAEPESALQMQDQQQTDSRFCSHGHHDDQQHRSQRSAEAPQGYARQIGARESRVVR